MRTLALIFALLMPVVTIAADKPRAASEKTALAKYNDLAPEYREKCVKAWKKRKSDLAGNTAAIRKHLENDPPFYPEMFPALAAVHGAAFSKGQWGTVNQISATNYGTYVIRVIDKQKALCRLGGVEFIIDGFDTTELKPLSMNEINEAFIFNGETTVVGSSKAYILKPLPRAAETSKSEGGNKSPNLR